MEDEEQYAAELKALPNQTWDMGYSQNTGTRGLIHFEDGKMITQKIWDAQPLADFCHDNRVLTQGESWGDGRIVGKMPPAVFAKMCADGTAFDEKAVMAYFRAHPENVTFEKFLRD